MIVYIHAYDKQPVAEHYVTLCPAGHLPKEFDGSDWWDETGLERKAKEFRVKFTNGECDINQVYPDVGDRLGKYMIATKLAEKSRLIRANW